MSTVRITKLLEDDRRLVDPDLVAFLRKKLDKGDILDFTDVVEVAPRILDALLDGWTPEQVEALIQNAGSAVMDAVVSWIDRRAAPVTPVERPRIHPRVRRPAPLIIPPPVEREPSGDERFTPTRLVQRLKSTLRGYIESAYPLSDPSLIRARRALLEQEAGGHLLAQEPYIEHPAEKPCLRGGDERRPPALRQLRTRLTPGRPRKALKAMKGGRFFHYSPDMDYGPKESIFVPFFGVPAATIPALSRLVRLTGACVVAIIARQVPDGYEVEVMPPWENFPGASVEEDTAFMNRFIESQVMRMPEQYFWLHKRFKTRPPGEQRFYK